MIARNFTWADLPALVEFVNLVRGVGGHDGRTVSLAYLKEELSRPGLSPGENCSLFEDDTQDSERRGLLAYSILHPELRMGRTILEFGIHPAHAETGIEREVVRFGLDRSKGLGARLLHICTPPSKFWPRLLEEEGFSRVRDYWLMQWHQEMVPLPELPEGFAIESFRPGDEARLTQAQNGRI